MCRSDSESSAVRIVARLARNLASVRYECDDIRYSPSTMPFQNALDLHNQNTTTITIFLFCAWRSSQLKSLQLSSPQVRMCQADLLEERQTLDVKELYCAR